MAVSASIVFPPPGASEENGLPHTSTRTQLPQSMKIMHEIMYKLEVLYVLCVLLMGRQRNQVGPSPHVSEQGEPGACASWVLGAKYSFRLPLRLSLALQSVGLVFLLCVLHIRKLVSFQSPQSFPPYLAVGSISGQSTGAQGRSWWLGHAT